MDDRVSRWMQHNKRSVAVTLGLVIIIVSIIQSSLTSREKMQLESSIRDVHESQKTAINEYRKDSKVKTAQNESLSTQLRDFRVYTAGRLDALLSNFGRTAPSATTERLSQEIKDIRDTVAQDTMVPALRIPGRSQSLPLQFIGKPTGIVLAEIAGVPVSAKDKPRGVKYVAITLSEPTRSLNKITAEEIQMVIDELAVDTSLRVFFSEHGYMLYRGESKHPVGVNEGVTVCPPGGCVRYFEVENEGTARKVFQVARRIVPLKLLQRVNPVQGESSGERDLRDFVSISGIDIEVVI